MTLTAQTEKLLGLAAHAADDAKAEDLVAIEVADTLPFNDAFLIVTADNPRHLRAVREAVEEAVSNSLGLSPRVEGGEGAEWLLLDYGDVAVHMFLPEAREFYALDRLWGHAPRVTVNEVSAR